MMEIILIEGYCWYVDILHKRMFEDREGKKPVDTNYLTRYEQWQISNAIIESKRKKIVTI